MSKVLARVSAYLRSFWIIDRHRGVIDVISKEGYYLNLPFDAQCKERFTGTRTFYRKVHKEALKISGTNGDKLMRVRLQERTIRGNLVILRSDDHSSDGMSVEIDQDPSFRTIADMGDEKFLLVNL